MLTLFLFLLACLGVYAAFRIVRGGFARPQSERLNAYGVIACAVLLILAMSWAAHPSETRSRKVPMPAPYPYVYVLADGSARELHASERRYLETEFTGGDGNMPYVKDSYEARNGWGEISGFLKRAALPRGKPVAAAPADDPQKPMSRAEHIAWLRAKGVEVIENADGSYTVMAKPRR